MSDDMPEVVWKSHSDYPQYQASTDGRVRSLDRFVWQRDTHGKGGKFAMFRKGRELSLHKVGPKRALYLAFDLAPNGPGIEKKRKTRVHRFVCEVFHGPAPTPSHEVRHLNGNPLDNRSENLCWGTVAENAQDRIRHGRQYRGGRTRI